MPLFKPTIKPLFGNNLPTGMNYSPKPCALLILVALCCYSCGQKESTQNNSSDEAMYELVKVDSLVIDEIETLQITDYNPKTERFLAYGTNSRDCMEVDMEGNIMNRVHLSGNGPGRYGSAMNGLSYFDEGMIINGLGKYVIYDADWGFKSKLTSDNYYSPVSYMSENPTSIIYAGERRLLQLVDQNEGGNLEVEKGHFDRAKMIKLASPSDKSTQALLNYPRTSIYVSNEAYFSQHTPMLSFNEKQNRLYVALPLESKLFVHNLDDSLSLDKTIDLDLVGFSDPKGIPYEDQFKNPLKGFGRANELNYVYMMSNSSIFDMSSFGNMTMIKYKTGIKNKGITSYQESLSLARQTSRTINSFIIDGKVVYETEESFRYPVRMDEMRFITPYLNEEVEVNYNKFYIYELQKTK